ncbi:zf-CCHC domain-containing protein/UBN2 domain-containing protein [Senna tora]|uniref:Zf-CCHC domain-containing protein/UBN2 domain-containing protein n=1 Tax=Senna tora TaxID=362788 RepID=A0A834W9G0_9FABA|nr:zf-CCHC domain-containing protein/UBN2 domain-containing protein [Senna tora]
MAYESTFLKDDQQELKKEDPVALKTGTTHEEDRSSTDPDEDKDMALLTRKLYNFYKKKYKNNQWKKGGSSSKVTCYECNKPGHIKAECPQLKGGKRKGLISTWSDDEFPDEDEEKDSPRKETANFCLMAKETEDEQPPEVTETNLRIDDLLETYNNLLEDSMKVLEKYGELKISHSKVLKAFGAIKLEKEALEEKIKLMEEEFSMSALITENRKLKATIDKLNYDLEQFVKGGEKLNLILSSQRNPNDKTGLGFTGESSEAKREVTHTHNKNLGQKSYRNTYSVTHNRRPRSVVDEVLENIMIQVPPQKEKEQSIQNLQEAGTQEVEPSTQLADIFTKPLDTEKFFKLRREIGLLDPREASLESLEPSRLPFSTTPHPLDKSPAYALASPISSLNPNSATKSKHPFPSDSHHLLYLFPRLYLPLYIDHPPTHSLHNLHSNTLKKISIMSSMSLALVKRRSSEETQPTGSRVTKIKLFDGPEAKARFENVFKERNCSPAREINLDFFYKEEFRCFEMFKFNGWEPFLSLKETVYPQLIREFYSNLNFDADTLESTILIRGRRAVLNKDLLSEVLQIPNHGLCPDLARDIITETYSKSEYIRELIGKESSICHANLLIADNRILFHIIDQVVMPRLNKANDPNNAELFIMWCLSRYLKVNLPHIILSHMKHICQSSHELAYGMVITRIAKFIKADISQYEGEEASFQSKFDIGLLHQMQFRKIGKHWVRKWKESEMTPKIEEVHELPKGGKRKNVGKGKAKKGSPSVRKSARLTKGKGKTSEKTIVLSDLEEEEASSHTEKDTPLSEETVRKIEEPHSPLSVSVETASQEPVPPYEPSSNLAELLKANLNEHTLFRLLQETLRSSTFTLDAQHAHHQTIKEVLASVNTTNELLTSIQHLLQKQITMASISAAAKVTLPPLRLPKPQIEDVD